MEHYKRHNVHFCRAVFQFNHSLSKTKSISRASLRWQRLRQLKFDCELKSFSAAAKLLHLWFRCPSLGTIRGKGSEVTTELLVLTRLPMMLVQRLLRAHSTDAIACVLPSLRCRPECWTDCSCGCSLSCRAHRRSADVWYSTRSCIAVGMITAARRAVAP